jgi:uncharacterized lipoprotein YmbA
VRAARIGCAIAIAFIAVVAASCTTTATSRFYTLESTATADGAASSSAQGSVMIGPVTIPAAVDRPEFVTQVAPNRVEVEEFNRWVAPLSDSIARVVAGNLVVILGTPDVAVAPLANFNPSYLVTIDVQRFDSIRGQAAVLEAVWTVRKTASAEARSSRTVARENAQGDSFEALAAAHSRALAKLSSDIATAIRAESEQKP